MFSVPGKTWIEIDRDERYSVVFVTFRCRVCRRKATASGDSTPTECVCQRGDR
jgi:hypothetical protein